MAAKKPGAPAPTPSLRVRSLDLAKTRRKRGISLEDIAARTKISLRFLRAIEAEEFEQLPGGIFNTSYLRQYATAIGFDESQLLAHYNDKVNPGQPPAEVVRPTKRGNRGFFDRWLRISAQAQ